MTSYVTLSIWDLALTSLLVLIDAGLSVALRLGIHRSLLIAAARMVVQLSLMGVVLTTLFALVSPLWTGLAALAMALFAGREIAQRLERPLDGLWSFGIGTFCMILASGVVTSFALLTALRPDPWYDPRYAIPLLGMILGNCMTGIALGLDTLTSGAAARRAGVEARLMLGGGTAPCAAAHHKLHVGDGRGVAAWNDDRPNPRRRRAGRSGQISNPDHVPDRGRDRAGIRRGGSGRGFSVNRSPPSLEIGPFGVGEAMRALLRSRNSNP